MNSMFKYKVGHVFGKLVLLERIASKPQPKGRFLCFCGDKFISDIGNVVGGNTTSCGCYRRKINTVRARLLFTRHGHGKKGTESPTYISWSGAKKRCLNSSHDSWKYYGGRGIKVCKRWMKFENFLKDMGERPEGTSIDRVNNDGNYEHSNCKWSTAKEQQKNKRRNPNGETQAISPR